MNNESRTNKIFICAENIERAAEYADLAYLELDDWEYLDKPSKIYGIDRPKVILYKDYYRYKYFSSLEMMLFETNAKMIRV